MVDPATAVIVGKFIIDELSKGAIQPSIRRAYAAIGIGGDNGAAEDAYEIRRTLDGIQASIARVENKIDEDRLTTLIGGQSMLREAPLVSVENKSIMLHSALTSFQTIAALPSIGKTAGRKNSELKAIGHCCLALTHDLLGNSEELISGNIASAYNESPLITEQFMDLSFIHGLDEMNLSGKAKINFNYVNYRTMPIKTVLWDRNRVWRMHEVMLCISRHGEDESVKNLLRTRCLYEKFNNKVGVDEKSGVHGAFSRDSYKSMDVHWRNTPNKVIVDPGYYDLKARGDWYGYDENISKGFLFQWGRYSEREKRHLTLDAEAGKEYSVDLTGIFFINSYMKDDYEHLTIRHGDEKDMVIDENTIALYRDSYVNDRTNYFSSE